MNEPYQYDDLRKRVSVFLGFGNDLTLLDSQQSDIVNQCVQDGYQQFIYLGSMTDPSFRGYVWSFLLPVTSITLAAGEGTKTLPDDFTGHVITVTPTSPSGLAPIAEYSEGVIREMRQLTPRSGHPVYYAVRPTSTTTSGTRWELLLWPTPSVETIIEMRYRRAPHDLSSGEPRPLGGPEHGRTLLECCLAEAEIWRDQEPGVHSIRANAFLMSSIQMDKRYQSGRMPGDGYVASQPIGRLVYVE